MTLKTAGECKTVVTVTDRVEWDQSRDSQSWSRIFSDVLVWTGGPLESPHPANRGSLSDLRLPEGGHPVWGRMERIRRTARRTGPAKERPKLKGP